MKEKDIKELEKATENAVYVSNDLDLKTEIRKKTLVIVSTDIMLYEKLLKKFPKEQVAHTSKKTGKVLTILGAAITVLTAGILAPIGLSIAGVGVVIGGTGIVLSEYKNYTIFLEYEKKQVIFFKTKGDPSISLPMKHKKINY